MFTGKTDDAVVCPELVNVSSWTSPLAISEALTKARLTVSDITLMAPDQGFAGKICQIDPPDSP
jgi:hypothetical protein